MPDAPDRPAPPDAPAEGGAALDSAPPEPAVEGGAADVHRSGYVALVGAPNVGKSTLLNRWLGTKLSIVSPRPSTTRNRVLGILSEGDDAEHGYQLIVLDTPGVVRPKYRLHQHMMRDVDRSLGDADVTVFLADATRDRLTHDDQQAAERVRGFRGPLLLALNKADKLGMVDEALPLVDLYTDALGRGVDAVVPVSALKGTGTAGLLDLVLERIPPGPPYYPKDQLSEHPERFFIAEIVREAVFHQFRDEVPYATQVVVVTYEERPDGKDFVACDVVVERDSQKAILIGKGGRALKRLGQAAREEIEAFLGRGVYLQLYVKTRADWRDREGHLREYGFGR
ncbi:GTPase Era [Rubrivirga sp. S365]|uniref:GTPase Era n=1 Tax=Rubrivirga litoralis TaxID=3075598 RepID=A0ABU3BS24_9BACT|nr:MULTISPECIES: GTPase Era [unclassified Rubrivirga]MDT0632099.1 GTPase Era [Rubrivirga sp. F394]MDT7856178.1 GTPase Era [Rubrivirga sp. S365]